MGKRKRQYQYRSSGHKGDRSAGTPTRRDDDVRSLPSQLIGAVNYGGVGAPPARNSATILSAYRTIPPLRAVVDRLASGVAMSGWHIYAFKDKGGRYSKPATMQFAPPAMRREMMLASPPEGVEEIKDHPLLAMLRSGNPMIVGVSLMELTQIYIDLTGESYWLKDRDVLSTPYRAWPIPPHWVQANATEEHPFYHLRWAHLDRQVPASEIVHFHKPDPLNPFGRGSGVGTALGDEANFIEFSSKHISSHFLNRTVPPWIGIIEGVNDETLKKYQARLVEETQGFMKTGKPILQNKPMKVEQLAQSFESLQLVDLLKYGRDVFLQTFGVPPELLAVIEKSNRSTVNVADYIHSRWNLVPRLEFIRSTLQERLVNTDYDEFLLLEYDDPVAKDNEFARQVMQNHPYAFEIDEIRDAANRGPDQSGNGHLHAVNGKTRFTKIKQEGANNS